MDKRALKSIIIELKESGLSYQDISDILSEDYDIHMSRQAVCGMYNRATSDEAIRKNRELILTTEDIVNYNLLGLDAKNIKLILDDIGYTITLGDIKFILSINTEYIKSVEAEQVGKVVKCLKIGNDTSEIKSKVTYKGLTVTEQRLKELIKLAAEQMIYEQSKKVLASVYNTTDDKGLVKSIIAEHNMNITMKDIENPRQTTDCDLVICDNTTAIVRPRNATTVSLGLKEKTV